MAFTAFNNPGVYQSLEGCTDCGDAAFEANSGCKECSCCPDGLVEQHDGEGKVVGCLTANDAQGYMITQYKCPDNKVKVIDATGNFIGCLSVDDYVIWLAAQV